MFRDCFNTANKVKSYFLGDCVFLEIRLINVNLLLLNMIRNKYGMEISNMKHLLYFVNIAFKIIMVTLLIVTGWPLK